ncbi:MAG: hypothetical protein U5K84_07080 [Alkalibacterium sp.]|nr:hypothetical protein [Alkalibacterium sp.]
MEKQHRYLPTTSQDRKEMLETIGISSIKELFSDIPESTRATKEKTIELKPALSEQALVRHMKALADDEHDHRHACLLYRRRYI